MNKSYSYGTKNGATWSFIINIITLILIVILSMAQDKYKNQLNQTTIKVDNTPIPQIPSRELPLTYSENYILKNGKSIRVNIPIGYNYTIYCGNKKIFIQFDDGEKRIIGGDINYNRSEYTSYFDLIYYDEEVTVVVQFKKN